MTGTLVTKTLPSGKSYYYIRLSYKDPITYTWKSKTLSTKLEVKNNKRNANAMIKEYLEKYREILLEAVAGNRPGNHTLRLYGSLAERKEKGLKAKHL